MTLTIKDIKNRIVDNLDPDDVIDYLNISTEELMDLFEYKLEEDRYYDKMSKLFTEEETE